MHAIFWWSNKSEFADPTESHPISGQHTWNPLIQGIGQFHKKNSLRQIQGQHSICHLHSYRGTKVH